MPDARANRVYCSRAHRTAAYERRKRQARLRAFSDQRAPVDGPTPDPASQLERLQVAVAEATQEPKLVAVIASEARQGNWRAAAWLLSRLYPSRWGERVREIALVPEDDPFAELDELAELRRLRTRPDGY
jgi:hypothetical protein